MGVRERRKQGGRRILKQRRWSQREKRGGRREREREENWIYMKGEITINTV